MIYHIIITSDKTEVSRFKQVAQSHLASKCLRLPDSKFSALSIVPPYGCKIEPWCIMGMENRVLNALFLNYLSLAGDLT